MDVKITKQKTSRFGQHKKLIISLIAVLTMGAVYAKQSSNAVSVKRDDILIGTVKQGDLAVIIEGYGVLTSDKQQLITALSSATVKQIVRKPGAVVTHDSVIVKMENPQLNQQVENDKQELALINGNLRQLKLNNKRESLNESAKVSELNARYQTAKLKREAEEKLVESGIVSQLTFKESVLNEQQLKQQVDFLGQRRAQLVEVHAEAVNIQLERIKQYQGRLAISQKRLDQLVVRAGFDGVLQRLSVELGQSLSVGDEIALIGSVTDLIAMIKVPQSQAQQVVVGQKAIIDTRADKIEGIVVRIDPVVSNNTVNIEISLPQQLPQSARPQLNVDGIIIAETLTAISYMERPANVKSNTLGHLYQLDGGLENAELKSIQFGRQTGRFIEVVSGAQLNDKFIVSELSGLKSDNVSLVIKS